MNRSQLREHIFKMLFQIEFNPAEDMPEHLVLYLDSLGEVSEKNRVHITDKYQTATKHISEIDQLINEKTIGWKTNRMNKVDLTILRLAVFEMQYDDSIPVGVAINEAVELAKKFSSDEGPAFINGVLAKMVNEG